MDNFLKQKIKCKGCGCGPANFTVIYMPRRHEYISKYDGFCSMGCHLTLYNRENRFSRNNTPRNSPRN